MARPAHLVVPDPSPVRGVATTSDRPTERTVTRRLQLLATAAWRPFVIGSCVVGWVFLSHELAPSLVLQVLVARLIMFLVGRLYARDREWLIRSSLIWPWGPKQA